MGVICPMCSSDTLKIVEIIYGLQSEKVSEVHLRCICDECKYEWTELIEVWCK